MAYLTKYQSHMGFKVSPKVKEAILRIADQQQSTPSQVIRKVVTDWLQEQERKSA